MYYCLWVFFITCTGLFYVSSLTFLQGKPYIPLVQLQSYTTRCSNTLYNLWSPVPAPTNITLINKISWPGSRLTLYVGMALTRNICNTGITGTILFRMGGVTYKMDPYI